MEEKKYPIWKINASWTQEGENDGGLRNAGLPKNRILNGSGFTRAFKEEVTEEEVMKVAKEWWHKMATDEKMITLLPELTEITVTFDGMHSWWLEWFNHCTYNLFENEQAAYKSFEMFLESRGVNVRYTSHSYSDPFDPKAYCAMGGDDRWRWEICDCVPCRDQGVTRIKH